MSERSDKRSNRSFGVRVKVGVLMGGPSAEHEVSLASAQTVLDHLDPDIYQPVSIKISKRGQYFLNGKLTIEIKALKSCDIIFNALHGTFGEDGTIQAICARHNVRYTGSGVAASALAMNKFHSRELFKLAEINVPKTLRVTCNENYAARLNFFITKITKLPVVVKPCSNGSSVGVAIVHSRINLRRAINAALKLDPEVLVEEYIKGREVTCAVLQDGHGVKALPVTEIIPLSKHPFFNYEAKYKQSQAQEITPAPIEDNLYKRVQACAVKTHQILGCRGYSRTDMIVKNGGTIYVLETNTLPGLTENSLLPKAAEYAGISIRQLLDTIIKNS